MQSIKKSKAFSEIIHYQFKFRLTFIKVSVKPFQRLAVSKSGALVAVRRQRNPYALKTSGREEKQSGVTVFPWETL